MGNQVRHPRLTANPRALYMHTYTHMRAWKGRAPTLLQLPAIVQYAPRFSLSLSRVYFPLPRKTESERERKREGMPGMRAVLLVRARERERDSTLHTTGSDTCASWQPLAWLLAPPPLKFLAERVSWIEESARCCCCARGAPSVWIFLPSDAFRGLEQRARSLCASVCARSTGDKEKGKFAGVCVCVWEWVGARVSVCLCMCSGAVVVCDTRRKLFPSLSVRLVREMVQTACCWGDKRIFVVHTSVCA